MDIAVVEGAASSAASGAASGAASDGSSIVDAGAETAEVELSCTVDGLKAEIGSTAHGEDSEVHECTDSQQ